MRAGKRLSDLIASGPLSSGHLLEIGMRLADVVGSAHDRQIGIGALSPSTVFVGEDGRVDVLDAGWIPISARRDDDLFGLGVLLYAMATGATPFGAGAPAPSPIELNPRLPSGLVRLIGRAIDPDPTARFDNAAALRDMLDEVHRAPGSLDSLLPEEHISSTAAVTPPPREELSGADFEGAAPDTTPRLFDD